MSKAKLPRRSAVCAAMMDELRRERISFTIARGGKHWRLVADICGVSKTFIVAGSPGDARAALNATRFDRRVIRETRESSQVAKNGISRNGGRT